MALLSRPLLCGNQATVSGEMWVTFRGMGSVRRPHRSHWAPLSAVTTLTSARSTQPAARGWFRTHARSPDCCIFALFTVRMWFIFSWLELWGMAGAACPPLSPSLWALLHSFITLIHYAVKVILTFHRTLKELFTFLLIPLVSFLFPSVHTPWPWQQINQDKSSDNIWCVCMFFCIVVWILAQYIGKEWELIS